MVDGILRRRWLGLAGLFGACGAIVGAVAAHRAQGADAARLATASEFLLVHALALLGLAALARRSSWLMTLAGVLFVAGMIGFGGGLVARTYFGDSVATVIPFGGTALILGWVALALAAVFAPPRE